MCTENANAPVGLGATRDAYEAVRERGATTRERDAAAYKCHDFLNRTLGAGSSPKRFNAPPEFVGVYLPGKGVREIYARHRSELCRSRSEVIPFKTKEVDRSLFERATVPSSSMPRAVLYVPVS